MKPENTSASIVNITLADGTKAECTLKHPILKTEGFKSVDQTYIDDMNEYPSAKLNIGGMVITKNGAFAVETIEIEQKSVPVYNFHVQSNGIIENCTYFANGIVVHNRGC